MTEHKTVVWGILGPGRIAGAFARDLPASKTGRLGAVASRDPAKAEAFAREHGADRAYGSYEELLDDDGIDAVYIATPHPMHGRWAIRTAEAGKHVLCEKPLTVNHAETMAVVEAARRNDVFLMEAYMYRCFPQTRRLVELIRDKAIGRVHQIQAAFAFGSGPVPGSRTWEPDLAGGGILDVGGYPVSAARLLAGAALGRPSAAEPTSVTAVGTLLDSQGRESPDGVDGWTVATLAFEDGITAHVTTGVGLSDTNEIRVAGSAGFLVVRNPWLPGKSGDPVIEIHRAARAVDRIEFDPPKIYAHEADEVAAHIADRQAPAMDWADTLGNMKVLDQWRSAIGLSYPQERLDADFPPVSGEAPRPKPGHPMRYGEIPGVDKRVSRLVMGCDNQTTLPHGSVMFDDFFERGGNTFDTAHLYGGGLMERVLGQWLRNRGLRDEVVLIGKGIHTPRNVPEAITPQLMESLERLQTDHLDVYFMHRDNEDVPAGEFVDVIDEHVRAGRIRAYGGSNWSLARIAEANAYAEANGRTPMVAASNQFSLARTLDVPWKGCLASNDDESREWLEKRSFVLMPWSSQARGFFTGRAAPDDRSDPELVRCWYSDDNFVRLERARELAAARGVAPTAVALAYVLQQDFPTFPLIGPRQISETASSFDALTVELTPDEVRWLDLRD